MPVTITLQAIPIGSIFTSTIDTSTDPPEPADKNDFRVRILTSENGTGLTLSNLSVSDGSIVSVDGSNAVWEAVVRPPETAVTALTFTVAADAFSEGNTETTLDIRVSTVFPDDDAETGSVIFTSTSTTDLQGIAVTSTRILTVNTSRQLLHYTHSGTEQTSEQITIGDYGNICFINGGFLIERDTNSQIRRYAFGETTPLETFNGDWGGVASTRLGILANTSAGNAFQYLPYGKLHPQILWNLMTFLHLKFTHSHTKTIYCIF